MRTQGQVADGVLVRWLRQGHSVTLSLCSIVLNAAKSTADKYSNGSKL